MPQPLQVAATSLVGRSENFAPVGSTAARLIGYTGPVAADPVSVTFKQPVGTTDMLRSGTYNTTLTFTLSTTTP
jgi:hypothetical protein